MADTNLTKKQRNEMIEFLEKIKSNSSDDETLKMINKLKNTLTEKKFWLVFEEHKEEVDDLLQANIPVLCEDVTRRVCKDKDLPWDFLIEWDNLQALYLLLKTHKWKINCIYIDPPYNTWARDWKYNNDYVDENDWYRHSKWLSMMKVRLELAKQLLNPEDSVLICTIDEKEYLHLWCLLEEMFPEATISMVSSCIKIWWSKRNNTFSRAWEYIFFVCIWASYPLPWKSNMLDDNEAVDDDNETELITWAWLRRRWGAHRMRRYSPGCFYPVFIDEKTLTIHSVGEAVPLWTSRDTVVPPKWTFATFPLDPSWEEWRRQINPDRFRKQLSEWTLVLWSADKEKQFASILFLKSWDLKKIEEWTLVITGRNKKGWITVKLGENASSWKRVMPMTMWNQKSHDASTYWTRILKQILPNCKFSFPKSLYAVYDTLCIFLSNKPNAIVLDFFAGSWTTMHAVDLLNAVDWWNRKCILVTNNEISEAEEKDLTEKWFKKWDEEWEKLWIAKSITWPRMKCVIEWTNSLWKPLDWNYWFETEKFVITNDSDSQTSNKQKLYKKEKVQIYPELEKLQRNKWLKANLKYFKCDWTPRKPEEYFLSNVLMLHIKEMIELENAIEIDNLKNVLILNKEDYNKYVNDDNTYKNIENIRVNQKIVFDSKEIEKMKKKNFKYIPTEYFWQELKDVAE